jgi:hypothetical protein
MAQAICQLPGAQSRAWEYWETRLAKRGGMPATGTQAAAPHRSRGLRGRVRRAAGRPARTTAKKAGARKPVTTKGGKRK